MPVFMNPSAPHMVAQHGKYSMSATSHYPHPHYRHIQAHCPHPYHHANAPNLKYTPHVSLHRPATAHIRYDSSIHNRSGEHSTPIRKTVGASHAPPPPLMSIEPLDPTPLSPPVQVATAPQSPPPPIAPTSWNPLQKLAAAFFDAIENTFIASLEKQHPLPSTTNPEIQLAGNFFPVQENAVQHELEVEGRIPPSLEGIYVRNGANPMFKPVAGHHLFDGDGMLHAVRFRQGIVSYANRFTRTHRLQEEEKLGRAFFPKAVGELHGHSGLARLVLFYGRSAFGLVDGSKGMGVANAGVVFFNGQLLAMSEDDLPYAVTVTDTGDLTTVGRYDFDGQLRSAMIAHPKVDAKTGELFALSYDVIKKPYVTYFKFSADGKKGPEVNITIEEPTMMHDFAITENYVVIPDQQVVFRLREMMNGGSPVVHAKEKMPRFGLLPRNDVDESAMIWVDVPDCFCFHLWNAWEEDEEIVVIASCMTPPDSIFNESPQSLQSILSEIRLNKSTRTSTRRKLISSTNLEAGQVNPNFLGRRSQFAYLAVAEPWPKVSGIAKVNLLKSSKTTNAAHPNSLNCKNGEENPCFHTKKSLGNLQNDEENHLAGKFIYPPNCYGGEPMFVPRSSDSFAQEDDGYVLTFMHNEKSNKSELLILDASSASLDIVARVKLPARVPYGFHGTFITGKELEHQKRA
ncbi:hypothetical protein GOP47_0012162 [Adiantum capillus-veneris]|uniref:9-cis-epoxycarotenoid dioxygenase n=1 Tax=Adiantum capillus-veneris TaxID=13818 RepID=A0A9D4ZGM2_ADICA|nr:hypothetical protein GOP47_0012162 [Adiantum capillus-veneris]